MKVVMINGSRREHGCTYTALTEMSKVFKAEGIDTEIFFVGTRAVKGEINDLVKEIAEAVKTADGDWFSCILCFSDRRGYRTS